MKWVAPIKDEETLVKFEKKLEDLNDKKYYILFEIGINTGMMLQDMLKLKVKDILGKDVFVAKIGAKNVEVSYKIPAKLKEIIASNALKKKGNDYLITGQDDSNKPISREQVYRVLRDNGREMGLSSIGAQTMRKTFAWRWYRNTGDIEFLQNAFCHATPTITFRYIGEKPNVVTVLKKFSASENAHSRTMLYKDDDGVKRIDALIEFLNSIKAGFDNPATSDAFFGKVDNLIKELEDIVEIYNEEE